ncbi:Queuine tRNA-ribosyltransferase accessory subunit 2 [Euphorbia peplus]|nr:Queuine tRNA-ribosyltransferase accessory subunit 2 [Euphorbia peplus]
MKPAQYMQMISSMRPNIWATLADEVPAWVSAKRNKTSVDRTIKWVDECISQSPADGAVFGAVVGGSDLEERKRCAEEIAKRNVSGYWIGGFGLGESMDKRPALLDAVTENLPEEKLRLLCGLGLPEEVLQGIAAGVDLLDSSYIYHLTLEGFALTFPTANTETDASDIQSTDMGMDRTKINLRATIYRKDTSPVVPRCTCYTCRNHTKAYINHLLNVHEMLAQILLQIHNTHHYLRFFESIRETIREGNFEVFRKMFVERRRDMLPAACA